MHAWCTLVSAPSCKQVPDRPCFLYKTVCLANYVDSCSTNTSACAHVDLHTLQGLILQGHARSHNSCSPGPSQAVMDALNDAHKSDCVVQLLRALTAGRLLTPDVKDEYLIYMQDFAPGDARGYD